MLSFTPLSTVPLSTAYTITGSTIKIPVEILATIRTIVEQIDIPVEILAIKTDAGVQKWVLSSRGVQWVIDPQELKWTIE